VGVLVLMAVGLLTSSPPTPPPSALPAVAWTAPTDFLLRTPGVEVLETTPRIGGASFVSLIPVPGLTAPGPTPRSVTP
jgi:hypothetical protein